MQTMLLLALPLCRARWGRIKGAAAKEGGNRDVSVNNLNRIIGLVCGPTGGPVVGRLDHNAEILPRGLCG